MHAKSRMITHILLLVVAMPLFGNEDGLLSVGIGGGIQSYPSALDPYNVLFRTPVLYPKICFDASVANRLHLMVDMSRTAYDANLWGCFCIQSLEMNTIAWGVAVDITTGKRWIECAGALLIGFGVYEHGGLGSLSSSGYGARFGISAHQPLSRGVVWSISTAVQRVHLQPVPSLDAVDLDSFSVELLVSLVL